jgi:hypothetical protein
MSDEITVEPHINEKKVRGRPFQKGHAGKKKGTRNKATQVAEKLLSKDIGAVVEVVIKAALDSDLVACKLILERLLPAPKPAGRMLSGFQLPVLRTAEDVAAALAVVIACVSNSLLTLSEASDLSALIERQGKALAASDHEHRLLALEAANAPKMIGRL